MDLSNSYFSYTKEEYTYFSDKNKNKMASNVDNNNDCWNADSSINVQELDELGCGILANNLKELHPDRRKRERPVRPEEPVYNDATSKEAKEFGETKKAKYVKADNFLYRQKSKSCFIAKDVFSTLSDEIILGIFKYLSHEDLKYVAQVNQRFRQLAIDESLWPRIDLASKMINTNSLVYILKRGVKILRLKEATVKTPIWTDEVSHLVDVYYSRLELLDMSYCVISAEDLKLLLSKCRSLRKISLESCTVNVDVCYQLSRNKYLDTLNLAMAEGLNVECMELLSRCERLLHINLAWTKLDKSAIQVFATSFPKSLMSVNLSGLALAVDDGVLTTLLQRCPRISNLDISDCLDVTTTVIDLIIKCLHNIKTLAISRCYKIDARYLVRSLGELKSLVSLSAFKVISTKEARELEAQYNHLLVNKDLFSTIARPTVGVRRTSIWQVRCRE